MKTDKCLTSGAAWRSPHVFCHLAGSLSGLTHTFCRSHFHAWERGGTDLFQTYKLPSAD